MKNGKMTCIRIVDGLSSIVCSWSAAPACACAGSTIHNHIRYNQYKSFLTQLSK